MDRVSPRRKKRGVRLAVAYALQAVLSLSALTAAILAFCGVLYIRERLSPTVPAPTDTTSIDTPPPTDTPHIPPTAYEPYEFGTPLEESAAVPDEWFDDAVFLGDSRTEGFQLFSGLNHGTFYCHRGMSVFNADSDDYRVFNVGGDALTLMGAVRAKWYAAVYLMLGINELGYPVSSFESALSELVAEIVLAQPEAVIYLETLPPVNDAQAYENGLPAYETAANVEKFNQVIVKIAGQERVVLLDTASCLRDAEGQLPEELTRDGVHFSTDGYVKWADYLRIHTMEPERYFYNRNER